MKKILITTLFLTTGFLSMERAYSHTTSSFSRSSYLYAAFSPRLDFYEFAWTNRHSKIVTAKALERAYNSCPAGNEHEKRASLCAYAGVKEWEEVTNTRTTKETKLYAEVTLEIINELPLTRIGKYTETAKAIEDKKIDTNIEDTMDAAKHDAFFKAFDNCKAASTYCVLEDSFDVRGNEVSATITGYKIKSFY